MKAAVCTAYGGPDVVRILDVASPVPRSDEVLVRIRATTVSSADSRIRGARFPAGFALPARLALGVTGPRKGVLGTELAGVVEAIGADVSRYRPGDRVFAFPGIGMGCHAELKAVREDGPLAPIPEGFSFEEAAAVSFGGTTALHFLRTVARLRAGERVLVNGASGAVGSAAVQLARHFGAHVTGVCSPANADLVRSLGAEEVIDYQTTDFCAHGTKWDIILDTVGNTSFTRCRPALSSNGRLLLLAGSLGQLLASPIQSAMSGLKVAGGPAPDSPQDVRDLQQLCAAGAYRPVVDSSYPFDRIIEAHARTDRGHKVGSVVVTLA